MLKKIIVICLLLFSMAARSLPIAKGAIINKNSASSLYEKNVPSSVFIATQDGSGSGIIVKEDGTLVTCFHVIANADFIIAKLADGSLYKVNGFRYLNPLSDVAILTLDTTRTFRPITIDKSNEMKIGEKIYTISNPQGLQFVLSDGIINQFTKDYIQFSAPISVGSSGGALLNKSGSLIGVITALINDAQNINFAMPNTYFTSKIDNKKIVNTDDLDWTDFVGENVSEDEFSMISTYALDKGNIEMWYKYLRTKFLPVKDEMPIELYPVLGYIALITDYEEDAIGWYKLSYNNDYNKDTAALALYILYSLDEGTKGKNTTIWSNKLSDYSNIVALLKKENEKFDKCLEQTQDEDACYENLGLNILQYIEDNTNFNWK